jgi:hypothetical protein
MRLFEFFFTRVPSRMTTTRSLAVVLALSAVSIAAGAELSNVPDRTYVTDGIVQTIVRVGDTVYIGGTFAKVGPRTGPGAQVSLAGVTDTTMPEVSGVPVDACGGASSGLRAVVADGSGGWYIGGCFSHVGAVALTNLAHILPDHSVDASFMPVMDGVVDALAASTSTLYVGGAFTSVGGQLRNNVAAVSRVDGSTTAFNPNADGTVLALALSSDGNLVYAGGAGFTSIGGQPRGALAALDAGSGVATAFDPGATGFSGSANIYVLAVSGSTLYVGGTFVAIGGAPRASIAALVLGGANDGLAVAGFDPSPSFFGCSFCSSIVALAVSGTTVYAGGSFDTIGGVLRNNVAGLDAADGTTTAFDPDSSGNILSLAASGSTVYIGGGFNTIGGQTRSYVAALDATTGSATAFDPSSNGSVAAIGATGSAVYLGGQFSSLGGVVRNDLAAISAVDGTPTSWSPNIEGLNGSVSIKTLAVSGSIMYIGGYFNAIGGEPRMNVGAINIADGTPTSWAPNSDGVVTTIAESAGVVYLGGSFIHVGTGGDQRIFLGAVNASDGSATAWNPNPDSDIGALAVAGGLVYVGGSFAHIGANQDARGCLAALDPTLGNPTAWNPTVAGIAVNCQILAMAIADSTVYVGGNFNSVHGETRNNVAAVNMSDDTPTSFNPDADGSIEALAIDGSTVYAGGRFTTIGGQPRNLIAALDAGNGSANPFNPDASGVVVSALAVVSDGTLHLGGSFNTFDLASQASFASFTPLVPNDAIFRDGFELPAGMIFAQQTRSGVARHAD